MNKLIQRYLNNPARGASDEQRTAQKINIRSQITKLNRIHKISRIENVIYIYIMPKRILIIKIKYKRQNIIPLFSFSLSQNY